MRSKFPGMDPYLELLGGWGDFHNSFLVECRRSLNERMPPGFAATIDERLELIEHPYVTEQVRLPDGTISRDPIRAPQGVASVTSPASTHGPILRLRQPRYEEARLTSLEIVRLPERRVVTTIDLLSPTNKAGEGWIIYKSRRRGLIAEFQNLVEIDLLLAGRRIETTAPLPDADYFTFITRSPREELEVYGWTVRDDLPVIPIPLGSDVPDVTLELQPLFDLTWQGGRTRELVKYDRELTLPIPDERRSWSLAQAR
jgi:hypothetical protein